MSQADSLTANPAVFTIVFQQNWENVRHIKSERIWFASTLSAIGAGVLSLLEGIHGTTGGTTSAGPLPVCSC